MVKINNPKSITPRKRSFGRLHRGLDRSSTIDEDYSPFGRRDGDDDPSGRIRMLGSGIGSGVGGVNAFDDDVGSIRATARIFDSGDGNGVSAVNGGARGNLKNRFFHLSSDNGGGVRNSGKSTRRSRATAAGVDASGVGRDSRASSALRRLDNHHGLRSGGKRLHRPSDYDDWNADVDADVGKKKAAASTPLVAKSSNSIHDDKNPDSSSPLSVQTVLKHYNSLAEMHHQLIKKYHHHEQNQMQTQKKHNTKHQRDQKRRRLSFSDSNGNGYNNQSFASTKDSNAANNNIQQIQAHLLSLTNLVTSSFVKNDIPSRTSSSSCPSASEPATRDDDHKKNNSNTLSKVSELTNTLDKILTETTQEFGWVKKIKHAIIIAQDVQKREEERLAKEAKGAEERRLWQERILEGLKEIRDDLATLSHLNQGDDCGVDNGDGNDSHANLEKQDKVNNKGIRMEDNDQAKPLQSREGEKVGGSGEREDRAEEHEEEMKRALREKFLAKKFMDEFTKATRSGGGGGGAIRDKMGIKNSLKKFKSHDSRSELFHESLVGSKNDEIGRGVRGIEGGIGLWSQDNDRIGGIPRRFLDLSHFPQFHYQPPSSSPCLEEDEDYDDRYNDDEEGKIKYFPGEEDEVNSNHGSCGSTGGGHSPSHIIDCTDDNTTGFFTNRQKELLGNDVANPSGPTCIPPICNSFAHDLAPASTTNDTKSDIDNKHQQKQITRRIYLSNASLAHVNGTYIQEGTYNHAPLFVRVGPPRKFMGKWECAVVLRRELLQEDGAPIVNNVGGIHGGSKTVKCGSVKKEYVWKIGLVPAHRITHPRLIGYYFAKEDASGVRMIMEHDEDDNGIGAGEEYYEPPVGGWRVIHQNEGSLMLDGGKASNLKICYEE